MYRKEKGKGKGLVALEPRQFHGYLAKLDLLSMGLKSITNTMQKSPRGFFSSSLFLLSVDFMFIIFIFGWQPQRGAHDHAKLVSSLSCFAQNIKEISLLMCLLLLVTISYPKKKAEVRVMVKDLN